MCVRTIISLHISSQVLFGEPTDFVAQPTNKPDQLLPNIARKGRALLQGLLLCGGCGRRLSPRYKGNGGIYPIYECIARFQDTIHQEDCIHIQANLVDQAVSQRVLEVLQPEQFQIALRAVNELQERSEAIDRQWQCALNASIIKRS